MIKTHNIATLQDKQGINDVSFEVHWDPNDKDSIKVELAGKISFISKDDLWNMVFSIVEAEKQQKMVPVIKNEMIRYQKEHQIELQKDMKKGEIVIAHCAVNVHEEIDKAIRRELEEKELSPENIKTPYLQENK